MYLAENRAGAYHTGFHSLTSILFSFQVLRKSELTISITYIQESEDNKMKTRSQGNSV